MPHKRREQSFRWKGGRQVTADGYVAIYQPDHPRAHGAYVFEHVLVVERAMGKSLRASAPVHHVNENCADNRGSNLVACDSPAYHKLLHQRLRARAACGDPNARRCVICHLYDRQDNITVTTGGRAYHRTCAAAATRKDTR